MGIANDLASLDATAQAELVRKGDVTSLELVEAAIDAAKQINPRIKICRRPAHCVAAQTAVRVSRR